MGGEHVHSPRLGLFSRSRAGRGGGGATLVGPALGVLLLRLELATLLEAFVGSWRHRDSRIRRRRSGGLLVALVKAAIAEPVPRRLRLELLATRRAGFSDEILEHIDNRSEVTDMFA